MGAGTGGETPQHDLLRGLTLMTDALDVMLGASAG